ncbi:unnamed protein product [Phaedon cochleariae]|uniref:SWIM-type domain-containing protein n=1 Tax=Phaedon cochleariae TaxID=80249 RepID=A0A9N9SAL3_PHACE|nr:unnamed protein product [Phaedon cochleariae]
MLLYDGFLHKKERIVGEKTIWKCADYNKNRCPGRVHSVQQAVVHSTAHLHVADAAKVQAKKTVEKMKRNSQQIEQSTQAIVKHSQRMNNPSLQVWIICEKDGAINSAHCTCMAGQSEVCRHVAAVLYGLEYIHQSAKNSSCTDVKAKWLIPSITNVSIISVGEMKLKRDSAKNIAAKNAVKSIEDDEFLIQYITHSVRAGMIKGVNEDAAEINVERIGDETELQEEPYHEGHDEKHEGVLATDYIDTHENIAKTGYNEELISLVMQRPPLYNFRLPSVHRSKSIDEKLWKEILTIMKVDMSVEAVAKKWKTLRDSYVKIRSEITKKPPSGSGCCTSDSKKI